MAKKIDHAKRSREERMRQNGIELMPFSPGSDNRVYHSRVPASGMGRENRVLTSPASGTNSMQWKRDARKLPKLKLVFSRQTPTHVQFQVGDRVENEERGRGTILEIVHPDVSRPRTLRILFDHPCITAAGRMIRELKFYESFVTRVM